MLRSRHVRRAYDVDSAAMSTDLHEIDRLAAALSKSKQLRAQSAGLLEHGRHLQKRLEETVCELTTLSPLWAHQAQELKSIETFRVECDGFFWHPILVDKDVGDFLRCDTNNVARVLPTGRRGEWVATVNLQEPSDHHRSATFDSKGEAREAVREWLRFVVAAGAFNSTPSAKMTNTNKPYGITFMTRKESPVSKGLTHESIAADLAQFEHDGGQVEVLGTTCKLKNIGTPAVPDTLIRESFETERCEPQEE